MIQSIHNKKISFLIIISISIFIFFRENKFVAQTKIDLLSWPRMDVDEFGCYLENHLNYKDEKYNCSSKMFEITGDPCQNEKLYYQGPQIPLKVSKRFFPHIQNLRLNWEHGKLQSISITLKNNFSKQNIEDLFSLPSQSQFPRKNVMAIDVTDCSKQNTCLQIIGFEHIGAGEAGCNNKGSGLDIGQQN